MKSLYNLVGMKYRGTEAIVAAMAHGAPLLLLREPDNPHDPAAVAVHAGGLHVGYVKGTEAAGLARQMDAAGRTSMAGSFAVTADRWPCVEVEDAPGNTS